MIFEKNSFISMVLILVFKIGTVPVWWQESHRPWIGIE